MGYLGQMTPIEYFNELNMNFENDNEVQIAQIRSWIWVSNLWPVKISYYCIFEKKTVHD